MIRFSRTDGMNSRTRKLNEAEVLLVRELVKLYGTERRSEIAALFRVTRSCISNIAQKARWDSVP